MNNICPICRKYYTEKNRPVLTHLKYKDPEETMIGCNNCNKAEYYYRHPEEVSVMLKFWRWWWRKRIKLVMEYYREKRTILKKFSEPQ